MPLEVLLPACTPDGSTSTASWAQGRRLPDLSVRGDARGVQQSTLRTEEVNKQLTFFLACIAALGALNPARPFFGCPLWGPFCWCCLHVAAPGAPDPPLSRVALGLEAAQRPPGTSAPHGS